MHLGRAYRVVLVGFFFSGIYVLLFLSVFMFVYISFNLISVFLRYCIYGLGIFHATRRTKYLRNQEELRGGLVDRKPVGAPSNFIASRPVILLLAVPRRLFRFASLGFEMWCVVIYRYLCYI